METYEIVISLVTNKQKFQIDDQLLQVFQRALQYVKGHTGINARVESYKGAEVTLKISSVKTNNLESVIDSFYSDFDGAVLALSIHLKEGITRHFFPKEFMNVAILQEGRVVREINGRRIKL